MSHSQTLYILLCNVQIIISMNKSEQKVNSSRSLIEKYNALHLGLLAGRSAVGLAVGLAVVLKDRFGLRLVVSRRDPVRILLGVLGELEDSFARVLIVLDTLAESEIPDDVRAQSPAGGRDAAALARGDRQIWTMRLDRVESILFQLFSNRFWPVLPEERKRVWRYDLLRRHYFDVIRSSTRLGRAKLRSSQTSLVVVISLHDAVSASHEYLIQLWMPEGLDNVRIRRLYAVNQFKSLGFVE